MHNKKPVTFLIDRAGLVGNDGETHHGMFDLSYLNSIPNIVVMAPKTQRDGAYDGFVIKIRLSTSN